jgi:transketolase
MNISMRDAFLDELYLIAREDRRVMLISNDFGAPSLDKFRSDLAVQFVHIGIAEENMVNVAAGLALAGKIVYIYSIAPFLPLRCYEQIRVHLSFKRFHITAVAVGTGFSYDLSGPTHHTMEDIAMMNALPGIAIYNPSDSIMGGALARMTYENPGPKYLRFDREKFPSLYSRPKETFTDGLAELKVGRDLAIVATGNMVHQAFKVAGELSKHSIDAGIIDLYRIKPLNEELLLRIMKKTKRVLVIEENFVNSGIGSIISGLITDRGGEIKLKCLGVPDRFFAQGGGREELHRLCGLDVDTITKTALQWLKKSEG